MLKQNLQEIRSKLHISASALKTYLQCPWKFRLRYVEGAEPEFRASALILGSAVHEALAAHHSAVQVDCPLPVEEVLNRFDEALGRQIAGEVPLRFKNGEDLDELRETGRRLLEVYLRESNRRRILAVEQPFQVRLVDPETGEELEPTLVGVFDLVESDEEGTVTIVELKTAARRWSAGQVDLDLQGSLYAEAAAQSGLVPQGQEALIRYEILVKNKKPVLDSQCAVRRPGDRQVALRIVVDVLKAIERHAFFRNPSWACAGCEFRKRCGV